MLIEGSPGDVGYGPDNGFTDLADTHLAADVELELAEEGDGDTVAVLTLRWSHAERAPFTGHTSIELTDGDVRRLIGELHRLIPSWYEQQRVGRERAAEALRAERQARWGVGRADEEADDDFATDFLLNKAAREGNVEEYNMLRGSAEGDQEGE